MYLNINIFIHMYIYVYMLHIGGQDTHRKRVIHTELHQHITDKRITVEKDFLKASYLGM
jgi:hypothetical protein